MASNTCSTVAVWEAAPVARAGHLNCSDPTGARCRLWCDGVLMEAGPDEHAGR